jgi:hypothetical protein
MTPSSWTAFFAAVALTAPYGPTHPLVSPNGAYSLFGIDQPAQLWLEDTRTHQRRLVFEVTVQTLTLEWAPDSKAFLANDRWASDVEFAYLYDVETLNRIDLRARILAADPEAARFFQTRDAAPHSYLHAMRWLDAHRVEVRLRGHTDGISDRPGDCFDLRYRANRDGLVEKHSQRVLPLTSPECRQIE